MKTITTVILALLLIISTCCSNQDSISRQSADLKMKVSAPKTDLHAAGVTDDLEAIRQHIKAGTDLNILESSRASTPLITAAVMDKTDAAKLLIDAGASLDLQNYYGSTPLHSAAFFCREEIVKALL